MDEFHSEPQSPEGPMDSLMQLPSEARLASVIKSVVEPSTWVAGNHSAAVYNGLLVVNHTTSVHEKIEQLLAEMRKVSRQPRVTTN
jgi:hypothetical protein